MSPQIKRAINLFPDASDSTLYTVIAYAEQELLRRLGQPAPPATLEILSVDEMSQFDLPLREKCVELQTGLGKCLLQELP